MPREFQLLGLNMDIHGERYQNECTNFAYGAISVLQLPQKAAYAVWDKVYAYTQDEWEGFGCCIDKEQALDTIKQYSAYAEAGLDEQFHVNPDILYSISTPPFYATKITGATFLTVCGGLRTNDKMQVCEEDDTPIEGLYNTGIMTGDFCANTYNFVMPGQNLGAVCGTLSYLLGRDLAEL